MMSRTRIDQEGDKRDQGQTIVEFALVISFLFLIIFGLVESPTPPCPTARARRRAGA
jgi:hypothetical protein